jgi:hypothetical protein
MVSVPSLFLVMVWDGRESSVSSSSSAQSVRLGKSVSTALVLWNVHVVEIRGLAEAYSMGADKNGTCAYPAGRDILAVSNDICVAVVLCR